MRLLPVCRCLRPLPSLVDSGVDTRFSCRETTSLDALRISAPQTRTTSYTLIRAKLPSFFEIAGTRPFTSQQDKHVGATARPLLGLISLF